MCNHDGAQFVVVVHNHVGSWHQIFVAVLQNRDAVKDTRNYIMDQRVYYIVVCKFMRINYCIIHTHRADMTILPVEFCSSLLISGSDFTVSVEDEPDRHQQLHQLHLHQPHPHQIHQVASSAETQKFCTRCSIISVYTWDSLCRIYGYRNIGRVAACIVHQTLLIGHFRH